ncbi:MAG TPA: hypothetical protein VG826_36260 [Pirellulales bacterium]|nr:hypothetical protein [Pirellulales bacterium]
MGKSARLICLTAVALILAAVCHGSAVGGHKLRQRTCNRCGVPSYRYGFDDPRHFIRVVAVASVEQPTAVAGLTSHAGRTVQRKVFKLPLSTVPVATSDPIQLSRMSLAIYDNGQIVATGQIDHNGGPYKAIQGNNVVVRLRAFAGTPQFTGPLDNAPMLWQTERTLWATRDRPQMISLVPLPGDPCRAGSATELTVPPEASFDEAIRQHFNEITHLEIELEYRNDR